MLFRKQRLVSLNHRVKTQAKILTAYVFSSGFVHFYDYGEQWGKESWTRTDFDKLPLSKLTNQNQYNAVTTLPSM